MILADQLGLGKTVQAIAFMSALYHKYLVGGPFLVIVPTSTISGWQEAIANWFPDALVVSLIGSKEDRRLILENEMLQDGVHRFHILLTTPTVALVEEANIRRFKWRLLCIDEAHCLKDKESKRNRIFTEFTTDAKLLITATPVNNNIQEFYNLLHFIDPDQFHTYEILQKFGTVDQFKDAFKACEISSADAEKQLRCMEPIPMQ